MEKTTIVNLLIFILIFVILMFILWYIIPVNGFLDILIVLGINAAGAFLLTLFTRISQHPVNI